MIPVSWDKNRRQASKNYRSVTFASLPSAAGAIRPIHFGSPRFVRRPWLRHEFPEVFQPEDWGCLRKSLA